MSKPRGRLERTYRVMWDQNHPFQSHYNPPMPPETIAQAHCGFFPGTAVDANVCAPGPGHRPTRASGARVRPSGHRSLVPAQHE
jgi:hypothetical protein